MEPGMVHFSYANVRFYRAAGTIGRTDGQIQCLVPLNVQQGQAYTSGSVVLHRSRLQYAFYLIRIHRIFISHFLHINPEKLYG